MAEKREGFGVNPAQVEQKGPVVLFETPDYRVVVGKLSDGPAGTAAELLVRYITQHKKHGVVFNTSPGLGQAIAYCVQAQIELTNAGEAAKEYAARNYKADKDAKGNGPEIPNFGMN